MSTDAKLYLADLLKRERENLQADIAALQDKVSQLQDVCPHFRVDKQAKASTGNYDWYEFRCPDCGKFWSENQ